MSLALLFYGGSGRKVQATRTGVSAFREVIMSDMNRQSSSSANRFLEILDTEYERARRLGADITLIFIKVGKLAEIGINQGQVTAERIMREINRLIRANIRTYDREFIYGNDELMIILPNTPKRGALNMINKLKRIIEGNTFHNGAGPRISLSTFFGIASYPSDVGVPGEELKGKSCGSEVKR